MKKPSANERRLAKLLREAQKQNNGTRENLAAFLAKRGVLAVCAATVPNDDAYQLYLPGTPKYALPRGYTILTMAKAIRLNLRRLARGAR